MLRRGILLIIAQLLLPPAAPQAGGGDCPQKHVDHGSTCEAGTTCDYSCDTGYYPSGAMKCSGGGGMFSRRAFSGGQCKACSRVSHCDAATCTNGFDATCVRGRCQQCQGLSGRR